MAKKLTTHNIKATFDARYKGRPPVLSRESKHMQGLPMLDIALGGLSGKLLKPVCDALEDDLTPAVESFLSKVETLVCNHISDLFHVSSKSDQAQFLQILNRFRISDIKPVLQGFGRMFFTQRRAKLTPIGLNSRACATAAEIVGKIFTTLPDSYEDVQEAWEHASTKEIPLIQQRVLEALTRETTGLVDTAWDGLRHMVYAKTQSESRLIRRIVKNFVNLVISEAAKTRPDADGTEVMLFELTDSLRAYVDKSAMFDDMAVARTVAAGLDDQDLESAVRRWAPDLPEAAPPMFPPKARIPRTCSGFALCRMYFNITPDFSSLCDHSPLTYSLARNFYILAYDSHWPRIGSQDC